MYTYIYIYMRVRAAGALCFCYTQFQGFPQEACKITDGPIKLSKNTNSISLSYVTKDHCDFL